MIADPGVVEPGSDTTERKVAGALASLNPDVREFLGSEDTDSQGNRPAPPPEAALAHRLSVDPTDPPRELSRASWVALIGLALAGISILYRISPALAFHASISSPNGPNPETADHAYSTWVTVQEIVLVLAAGLFLSWFFLAYSNLQKLGVRDHRFSNGWALGSWFVPFLNLVRPSKSWMIFGGQTIRTLRRDPQHGSVFPSPKFSIGGGERGFQDCLSPA